MAATVTTSHFVSRTANLNGGSGSESKVALFGSKNQYMVHNGLRALNRADSLQLKTNAKAIKQEARKKNSKADTPRLAREIMRQIGMNTVFVSTEAAEWCKTGGLGDVLGGLPPALAANGNRVMTICPRYDQYKDAWDTNVLVELKIGDRIETVRYFHCHKRGVDRVFVDHPMFLEKVWGKTGSKLYGPNAGTDYEDNQLRFSLLCLAALEGPRVLNLNNSKHFSGPYGENVIFVANDWHTALLPCYLKSIYQSQGTYKNAKVAFCIHNMAYQGRFAFSDFSLLNLPNQFKSSFDFIDGYEKPVKGRKINWMKAGMIESDIVLTVSPYYAKEISKDEAKGVELDACIRNLDPPIKGIINGMDAQDWNPTSDKYIDVHYDSTTVMDAKPLLKEALQAEVGLPVDRDIPVIGFIGRLEEQKGSDILAEAIPEIIKENVQIIILGTGKKYLEKQLEQLQKLYPDKVSVVIKFNVPLAHMIMAGATFMLLPSRFEPCGLNQLYAMSYGTIPIVTSTGGLVDTVKEGYTGFHMGAFNVVCDVVDPADVEAVAKTVKRAIKVDGTPAIKEMIQNCMSQDLSWKKPAKEWEKVLLSLGVEGSAPGIDGEEIAPLAKENVAAP
ncbi:hypothetical protein Sjap_005720 [Stephania japonica]|uniref:Starch synthase catalytic domain-containing protein n=1 Tax=Stephania japonica TaxID=461633 RepID=A0AAP0K723_9MAGN